MSWLKGAISNLKIQNINSTEELTSLIPDKSSNSNGRGRAPGVAFADLKINVGKSTNYGIQSSQDSSPTSPYSGHYSYSPELSSPMVTHDRRWIVDHHAPILLQLLSGVILGILIFAFCNVYASVVFTTDPALHRHLQASVGINVLAAAIMCAFCGVWSDIGVVIGSPDINPTIIHVSMANVLAQSIDPAYVGERLLPTMLAAIAFSSISVGVALLFLGTFKLTKVVQFAPSSVIRGFLACIGMEIMKASIENATAQSLHFGETSPIFESEFWIRFLPALAVGVPLYYLRREKVMSSGLLFPLFVFVPLALFWSVLTVTQTHFEEARKMDWMYPKAQRTAWLDHWYQFDYLNIDYHALLKLYPYFLIMIIIVSMDFLLKLAGAEEAMKEDIDIDHQFCYHGVVNMGLGLITLPPAYTSLKFLVLNYSVCQGVSERLPTVVAAVINFGLFFSGFPVINYFPRFLLAGLFIYAAMGFLVDNLFDSYWTLTHKEFGIVWFLTLSHLFLPLYVEVAMGLFLASGVFVLQYATRSPIKLHISGGDYRAVTRTIPETLKLGELGEQMMTIIQLNGYIFFGSASHILKALEQTFRLRGNKEVCSTTLPAHYIILDFENVTGVDTSSTTVFSKLSRRAKKHNFHIIWTGLSYRRYMRLKNAGILNFDFSRALDLDAAAEHCEDQLLEFSRRVRKEWLVTDALCYIHAIHCIQRMAYSSFHGFVAPNLLTKFFEYGEECVVEAGQDICEVGMMISYAEDDALYYVGDGRLEVYDVQRRKLAGGEVEHKPKRLAIRGTGAFLNAECFWLGGKVRYCIIAKVRSTLWRLSQASMAEMKKKSPELAIELRDSVLRHTLTADLRLRSRIAAYRGGYEKYHTSDCRRPKFRTFRKGFKGVAGSSSGITAHGPQSLASSATYSPTPPDCFSPKASQGVSPSKITKQQMPDLMPLEVAQYTNLFVRICRPLQGSMTSLDGLEDDTITMTRRQKHMELYNYIRLALYLQRTTQPLSEMDRRAFESWYPSDVPISLQEFLRLMQEAWLAPLSDFTTNLLWNAFSNMSPDGETLVGTEVVTVIKSVESILPEEIQDILSEVKIDPNSTITFDTLLNIVSRLKKQRQYAAQLQRMYVQLIDDSDAESFVNRLALPGDRGITFDSLKEGLTRMDCMDGKTDQVLKSMIREADGTGNGCVGFEEFVTAACNL